MAGLSTKMKVGKFTADYCGGTQEAISCTDRILYVRPPYLAVVKIITLKVCIGFIHRRLIKATLL